MKECQVCFNDSIDTNSYNCKQCRERICFECISEYIKHSSIIKCQCNTFIFPSYLPNDLPNLQLYKTSLLKQIEMKNFSQVTNLQEDLQKLKLLRKKRLEKIMTFPVCIQYTINTCFKTEFKKIKLVLENKQLDYTQVCQNSWCSGTLEGMTCKSCNTIHCSICKEVQNSDHVCNKDTLESLKLIETELYKCPGCKLPIQKSSGCSYLTCAACNTKFDHTTNEIGSYGGHTTSINVKTSYNTVSEKYKNNVSKDVFEKIMKLENSQPPDNKRVLVAYVAGDSDKSLGLYEKYLINHQKYTRNIQILKDLDKNPDNLTNIIKIIN